jgi:hypothetical protein
MSRTFAVVVSAALLAAACGGDSTAPEQPNPVFISIVSNDVREIPAGACLDYKFTLPAGTCALTGRIEGVSGGNKDFEAMVVDDDGFRNWTAGLTPQSYVASGRQVVWNLSAQAQGPRLYHLIVSNAFSTITAKVVTTSASATC